MLGPTDLYVCSYLSKPTTDTPRFEGVAEDLGVGLATAHRSVGRLLASGLGLPSRTVQRHALLDVLLDVARHVYYVQPGGLTRGVRTADAAAPLSTMMTPSDPPPVWPDPLSDARGTSIKPLHVSVPRAAKLDPELHASLALVDAPHRPSPGPEPGRGGAPQTSRAVNPPNAIGREAEALAALGQAA